MTATAEAKTSVGAYRVREDPETGGHELILDQDIETSLRRMKSFVNSAYPNNGHEDNYDLDGAEDYEEVANILEEFGKEGYTPESAAEFKRELPELLSEIGILEQIDTPNLEQIADSLEEELQQANRYKVVKRNGDYHLLDGNGRRASGNLEEINFSNSVSEDTFYNIMREIEGSNGAEERDNSLKNYSPALRYSLQGKMSKYQSLLPQIADQGEIEISGNFHASSLNGDRKTKGRRGRDLLNDAARTLNQFFDFGDNQFSPDFGKNKLEASDKGQQRVRKYLQEIEGDIGD